jgi:uncharacterized protein (UPF0548 family)
VVGFVLGSVSESRLALLAEEASNLSLSYGTVGVTQLDERSSGRFRRDAYHVALPGRAGVFDRAVEVLRHWQAHTGAGLRVAPASAPIQMGVSVVVALSLPGMTAVAPCRIVWVLDEPDRFGFAYGTLEGHPESGEESFVVTTTASGVRFDVIGVSRPSSLLARLGGPVTRRIQITTTRRYLTAFAAAVSDLS